MVNSIKDAIRIIGQIIIILVSLVIIYQIIKAILGGTWATENIIVGALGVVLSGIFIIVGFLINLSRALGKIEERTKIFGESLLNLGRDFKEYVKEKHKG